MKNGLICLIVVIVITGLARASVLDQAQQEYDLSWLVICSDWSFAQTFTAGMNGQLEKVDLYLDNTFASDLYPSTVSIVNVINNAPSGSVLGQVYADNLTAGLNSINFLPESVFLTADVQYGIVLSNNDSEKYAGTSTQWRCKNSDIYAGGSLWVYMDGQWLQEVTPPGGGTPEIYYDKDAAFITYMVPEPATLLLLGLGSLLLKKRN